MGFHVLADYRQPYARCNALAKAIIYASSLPCLSKRPEVPECLHDDHWPQIIEIEQKQQLPRRTTTASHIIGFSTKCCACYMEGLAICMCMNRKQHECVLPWQDGQLNVTWLHGCRTKAANPQVGKAVHFRSWFDIQSSMPAT